jgi:hypothetical protein
VVRDVEHDFRRRSRQRLGTVDDVFAERVRQAVEEGRAVRLDVLAGTRARLRDQVVQAGCDVRARRVDELEGQCVVVEGSFRF